MIFCFSHFRHLHFSILCPQQNVDNLFRTVPPANRRSTRSARSDFPPVKTVCPSVHDGTASESVHETTLRIDGCFRLWNYNLLLLLSDIFECSFLNSCGIFVVTHRLGNTG